MNKIKIQILVLRLVVMCVSVSVYANGLGYMADYSRKGSMLTVTFNNGKIKVTPCSNDIFKIIIEPNGTTAKTPNKVAMPPRQVNYDVNDNEDNIVMKLYNGNEVSLQKTVSQLSVATESSESLIKWLYATQEGDVAVMRFGKHDGEMLYGYNKYGILNASDGGNVPSFFSSYGYGVYFDGNFVSLQVYPDAVECSIPVGEAVTFYLITSEHGNMAEAIKNYTELVGRAELIAFQALRDTVKKYCTAIKVVSSDVGNVLGSEDWLPYNYTLAYEMAVTGLPFVMPPCSYNTGEECASCNSGREYLWGRNVLVASKSDLNNPLHDVCFPCGKWYSWENPSMTFTGPAKAESEAMLFVKAGAFIPMLDKTHDIEEYTPSRFVIRYFTGVKKSEYSLFDDDRESTNTIKNNKHQLIDFIARENDEYLTISIDSRGWGYMDMPDERIFTFELITMEQVPKKVMWGDCEMKAASSIKELTANTYYYDSSTQTIWVKVVWDYAPTMLSVEK